MADLLPDLLPDLPADLLTEHLTEHSGCFVRSTGLLARVRSPYQEVEVHDSVDFGKLLRIDGHFMCSEHDEYIYHENLVHVAALTHPRPESALVIGGGDGGAAEELLKHPSISAVTLVEIDGAVVEVSRAHLEGIHRNVFADPRLTVSIGDGLDFVATATAHYDLIVLDLTDPSGPSTPLFTEDFYRLCAARLFPGGALTLQVASPIVHEPLIRATLGALRKVFAIVVPYLVPVPLYNGLWMLAFASQSLHPAELTAHEADRRIAERALPDLRYYNGDMHRATLALPNFVRRFVTCPTSH